MIEPWMISLVIAIIGFIAAIAVTKQKVTRLESDLSEHIIEDKNTHEKEATKHEAQHKDLTIRTNSCFKRIDESSERITILDRDTANLLDLKTAEEKFVTRVEMRLHLEKIEIITQNTNAKVENIEGKQDAMLDILHGMQRSKNEK